MSEPVVLESIPVEGAPYAVTAGPDGALWFTLAADGRVARWADGAVEVVAEAGQPTGIAAVGGAVWWADSTGNRLGSTAPSGGVEARAPYGLCAGPDGALWCTEMGGSVLRVADPASENPVLQRFPLDGMPSFLAAGPDGALWCTLNQANAIARITVDGDVTRYPLPTAGAGPVGICAGRDGALWFAEILAGAIGRIGTDGAITEFPLPDPAAKPHAVVAGPDGGVWFTAWGTHRIGRIGQDGAITGAALPGREPHGLTVGPDGALWVALESGALVRVRGW